MVRVDRNGFPFPTVWGTGLDAAFDGFFAARRTPRSLAGFGALDVWEHDERLRVDVELPGVAAEGIDLSLEDNVLTLTVEVAPASAEDGAAWHRRERHRGSFSRAIELPTDIDPDGVEAVLEAGILKLTLPRAATARKRKIEIR